MAAIGTRLLKLTIGVTEYTAQVSKCVITSAPSDADFTSFADAAAGGARDYFLEFVAVQDPVTGTMWDQVWSAAGTTVTGKIQPFGNATASVDQPHYTFSAVVTEPDGDLIGGEADSSTTARMTIECKWALTAKPVKVSA